MNVLEQMIDDLCIDPEWKAAMYVMHKGKLDAVDGLEVSENLARKAAEDDGTARPVLLAASWYLKMCVGSALETLTEKELVECGVIAFKYLEQAIGRVRVVTTLNN